MGCRIHRIVDGAKLVAINPSDKIDGKKVTAAHLVAFGYSLEFPDQHGKTYSKRTMNCWSFQN